MNTPKINEEFCSEQTATKLMWGLLLACTLVSLNLMIEQIGDYAKESELAYGQAQTALSSNASQKAKNVLETIDPPAFRAPEETDSIIVKYKDATTKTQKGNIEKAEGLTRKGTIDQLNVVVYDVDTSKDTGREVTERMKLNRKGEVEFVEVNMRVYPAAYVPNDPYYGGEWHIPKIQADMAWDMTKGEGVTIAVMDGGVECTHPDLTSNCVSGYNAVTGTTDTTDITGHGTAVAGTIASVGDNSTGGTGVSYRSKIMPINIATDSTGATTCDILAQAITYAADHGIKVVSNSYFVIGCTVTNSAAKYLTSKGGVYVRAAGNTGVDETALVTQWDPSVNDPNIVVVSATDVNDVRASWSTYGKHVDISAPGTPIYCTQVNSGYGNCWGTSFSVPIVSGVLGLMYSANPALSADQARNILFLTADDLGPTGWDIEYGYGRVNAARAVALAQSTTGGNVVDTLPPSVPQGLTASNVTGTSVTLSWSPATDNVGVAGYDVYQNGTKLTTVSGTLYTSNGLFELTPYSYTVFARDAAGNTSSSSNQISTTTLTAPLSITSSAVTVKTGTTATVAATTNKTATVTVKYGLTATALTSTATTPTPGTSHTVPLTGLKTKSKYFYQVTATGPSGETATSPMSNFRTGVR